MASDDSGAEEFRVTFNPPLYLERQRWVLDILRREAVQSVLDIGCGEGSLLQCLTMPSQAKPPSNLPVISSFVSGKYSHTDLHLQVIHGLDPHTPDLESAICGTTPPSPDDLPFTGYSRWRTRQARWASLEVNLWEGGFENINADFKGDTIHAFVASEVIEHLPPALLPSFAPILLGYYRPRLLLLTTPNYTYNQRFSPPGERSSTGYLDPTGRTERVFRHHDHKFEWTTEEWTRYCTDAALEFGYDVEIDGVGLAVEPDPWDRDNTLGFASHVAAFRRIDSQSLNFNFNNIDILNEGAGVRRPTLRAKHVHLPHPLSLEDLERPPVMADIRRAVKDAMKDSGEGSMTFDSVWRHGVVSLKCAGDIAVLVNAFRAENLGVDDDDEWSIMDNMKGWEATIVWKNFVMPKDTLQLTYDSQNGSSSSQGTNDHLGERTIDREAEEWSPSNDLVPLDEGSAQTDFWGWEENYGPWGPACEKDSTVPGWGSSNDNVPRQVILWEASPPNNLNEAAAVDL